MRKYIIILIALISILGCQEKAQPKKKNIEPIKNDTIILKETIKIKSTTKEMSNKTFFELIHYYQDNYEHISKKEFSSDLLPNFKKLKTVLCANFDDALFNEYTKMIFLVDKKLDKTEIEEIFIEIFNCQKGKTTDLLHQQQKDSFFLKILNKKHLSDKIFKVSNDKFELKMPNKRILFNNGISKLEYGDVVYAYLLNNYKITSKKEKIDNLCNYGFVNYRICKFSQRFEQIYYSYSACEEAKGSMTIITIPKIDLSILHKWVERINSIENGNQDYTWKNNGLNYEPKEVEPGCYYSITFLANSIQIKIYCGC